MVGFATGLTGSRQLDLPVNTYPRKYTATKKTVFDLNSLPVFDRLQMYFTGEGGAVVVSLKDSWSLDVAIPRSKAP